MKVAEKAVLYGYDALTDSETLTLITGVNPTMLTGLLEQTGNLRSLSLLSVSELQHKGLTKVQASKLAATLAIARRFQQITLEPGKLLNNVVQVFTFYHEKLRDQKREHFFVVLLDAKHRFIREELVSVGSLNFSIVHPREVFKPAIRESAESLIIVHNHPSGDATPSREDIQVTKRLVEVGKTVGIEVLDHIVIGNGSYLSFQEQRLM